MCPDLSKIDGQGWEREQSTFLSIVNRVREGQVIYDRFNSHPFDAEILLCRIFRSIL